MKAKPGDTSLWLPGFEFIDEPPAPDLFAVQIPEAPAAPPVPLAEAHAAIRKAWRPAFAAPAPALLRNAWPSWSDTTLMGLDSTVVKFDANVEAIETLMSIEASCRGPTEEERRRLLRYTGWGGIPASFNEDAREPAWARRAVLLRQLLDAEDFESARSSVNNSHYTDPVVIHWVWSILQRLGFTGGSILEPSAGIGHFIGCMPAEIAERSRVTAIEIDRLSGRILRLLYGAQVDVRISGFENAKLADASWDLVLTNVPFGQYGVLDHRNRPYSRASIHNWFIGRALDVVRPGGLVCVITSTYFMDGGDDSIRAHVASEADLVGAIRLPSGTFERLASTSVQADLVVLQKRVSGKSAPAADWLDLGYVPKAMLKAGCYDQYLRINSSFVRSPERVLGKIDKVANGYEAVPTAVLDGDLKTALDGALPLFPEGAYTPRTSASAEQRPARNLAAAPPGSRPGSFVIHDGRIGRVEGEHVQDLHEQLNATARQRVAGMVDIRDRARALLNAQLGEAADAELESQRRSFNHSYDRFVQKHGCLSSRANALAFRRDPDYPLLLSLEHYDEEEDTATKAAIFRQRTVSPVREATTAGNPDEALALSMQWKGRVDADYMGRLLLAKPEEVISDLHGRGMIFCNPESGKWEPADQYLSGDVKRKLNAALSAGDAYQANVSALEKVIPEDLPPGDISLRLGAVWVPADVIEAFAREVLKVENVSVRYMAVAGTWSVTFNDWTVRQNVVCTQEYGTARMHAMDLVMNALNVQTPTVRDPHPLKDGAYVVNKEETLAAREKLALIRDRFAAWGFEDPPRRDRLCRIYNDLFNCLRQREFDGSHLTLPGFSNCFTLHQSQRNAIWRIVQSGNTGLFHAVGAGKTAILACAGMELRRLGLANKPTHIVQNSTLEQYTAELVRLYPSASVLMATKEDLAGDRRREFVARVATGDWDAIVMTHSTFEMLPMSAEFTRRFIKEIISEIEMAVRASKEDYRSNRIVKQLERMKKAWKLRLERLENIERKDDFLSWESLGIDFIAIDEAHAGKNLFRHTKMARIAGLPLSNSQRAFDLYLKTRYTMSLYGGEHRGIVMATATPISNSLAEVHVFQRYLQPNTLRAFGLEQFDAWAATFGETVNTLELAPDGSGYRMASRFARFINVPDLMSIFCDVSDIRTREMLKLAVPRLKGDKPRTVVCKPSEELRAFVRTLVKRAETLKTKRVDPTKDNMLLITTEGRMAALDMRLIDSSLPADPEGKVAMCALEVRRIWNETTDLKRAQLVFCDLSTPTSSGRFSVYHALRDELKALGIPASEIAFIHDADSDSQKARLFRQVREGKVRVLLGSTQKMGVGTNVQRRLVALHELDCPWRPCDIEQREGRILRQGNECEEVEIIRYVTEGSFDAYSWQTVTTKAKFITQVMSGDKAIRTVEDVELATLTYAEVKALASGNPKVIEKAGVDAEIAKYASLLSVWRNQRYSNESEVTSLPMRIASTERLLAALEADVLRASDVLSTSHLEVKVHGRGYLGRDQVADVLRQSVRAARASVSRMSRDEFLGNVGAFELWVAVGRVEEEVHLFVKGDTSHDCVPCQTGPALFDALIKTLSGMETHRQECSERLRLMRQKLEALKAELGRPFEFQEKLTALVARQRELDAELDLGKDEVGSNAIDDVPEKIAA
ncbi:helicase-related protein [Piscinibacter gummiphilus]|uniref:DEAD/DEAH box helicase n=1 Tax=Piscinibacter gummiphilus TaxID=946333 RepID=A0ABZ0D776_9BURK|nr:helicase-related protein [Piscinibacter gummiphilus]WOB11220.1 DEAD/DEAH box helicase [Piscinibacter gummiphilus]